jgi:hypothetical protein
MSSTVEHRRNIKIRRSPAASNSPVTTDSYPCTFPFGVTMAFTTGIQMYTPLTGTLFELLAKDLSFPSNPLPHIARIPSSSPQTRPDRLGLKSGPYNLVPLVKITWISSHAMSRVPRQNLTTIRSIALTLKNRLTSKSNWLKNRRIVSHAVVLNSSWTLDFFGHPRRTINDQKKPSTGLSSCMMATVHTSSSWIAHHGKFRLS